MKILLAINESPCAEVAVREVEERFTMRDTTVDKFAPPAATLWYDGGGNPKAAHAKVDDPAAAEGDENTKLNIFPAGT